MPESIDWSPPHPPWRRRRFFLILAVLAGIFFGGWTSLSYYVDVLWFGSLGYGDVFWKTIRLQTGIFTAFAAATFLILYGSFLALKRAQLPDLPSGQTIIVGGQPLRLPVEPVLRLIALGVSLAVIICLLAIFFIAITGGARALTGRRRSYVPLPWRGFSITFAFLLLVLAMRVYLGRFERLFEEHTIFGGVTYTDAHVMLTGMLIVCAALVLGAAIAV